MDIKEFEIDRIYKRQDLMDAFKGAFQGGINICKRTNTIVITSLHTDKSIYDDDIGDELIYYTGEGQIGDQKLQRGNKAIFEASKMGRDIHLFIRYKATEYTYLGKVELVGPPKYVDEKDVNGNMRKVIKFPMLRATSMRKLTDYETRTHVVGGTTRPEKRIIQVVGAAIINDKGELLCAQRGSGSLIGKWEFPGGKVEKGETDQVALAREIKEELNIDVEVEDLIGENNYDYGDQNINLKVYRCKYVAGEIKDTEHQSLKWMRPEDLETLDWAEADCPIVERYLDSLPKQISGGPVKYNYVEADSKKESTKEIVKAAQDYEKSQKRKQESGDSGENAVIQYEKDKLTKLGYSNLAERVEWVSKNNQAAGYDVRSFDIGPDGTIEEIHIEVKVTKKTNEYLEFFISDNELTKFKNNRKHKIYCLIRSGRSYKLHEVNKEDFFKNDYLSPLTYRAKIKVAK